MEVKYGNRQVLIRNIQAAIVIDLKYVECEKGGDAYQFEKNSAGII